MLCQHWGILRTHDHDRKLERTVKASFSRSISKPSSWKMSEKLRRAGLEVSLRDKDALLYKDVNIDNAPCHCFVPPILCLGSIV
jgi:hypothetical protein